LTIKNISAMVGNINFVHCQQKNNVMENDSSKG